MLWHVHSTHTYPEDRHCAAHSLSPATQHDEKLTTVAPQGKNIQTSQFLLIQASVSISHVTEGVNGDIPIPDAMAMRAVCRPFRLRLSFAGSVDARPLYVKLDVSPVRVNNSLDLANGRSGLTLFFVVNGGHKCQGRGKSPQTKTNTLIYILSYRSGCRHRGWREEFFLIILGEHKDENFPIW